MPADPATMPRLSLPKENEKGLRSASSSSRGMHAQSEIHERIRGKTLYTQKGTGRGSEREGTAFHRRQRIIERAALLHHLRWAQDGSNNPSERRPRIRLNDPLSETDSGQQQTI